MSLLNLDFTGKDYDSLVSKADEFAKSLLPEWTARDDNDLNWVTVKTVAYLVSIGMFYIDLGVSEQDPYEVQIYRNALRLARRYGMPVKKAVGAVTTLNVVVKEHTGTKTIPRGTQFTCGGKPYVVLEDISFPEGVNAQPANVQYGNWSRITLATSTGEAFQEFSISADLVQSDSLRVFINEGAGYSEWAKQDSLLMSVEDDLHFRQVLEDTERYTIMFGDSNSGKIPAKGASIQVELITLPSSYENDKYGNLASGNTFTCSDSDVVAITQGEAASGGSAKESILSIGRNLPQWLSTSNRCIAPNDYRYLARRVPGVQDATVNQESVVVSVYIVPSSGGVASTALMDKVAAYLDARKMNQVTINVLVPKQIKICLEATVTAQANVNKYTVLGAVIDKITSYLNQSTESGALITLMDAYAVGKSVAGVKTLTISKLYRADSTVGVGDIQLSSEEVAVPGVVSIVLTGMQKVAISGVCKTNSTGAATLNVQ